MNAAFFNRCGQMDALRTSDPAVRMAQALYTDVVLLMPWGRVGGWLKFPLTAITKTGLLRAVVAPCTANGIIQGGGRIWMNLPEERVIGPEALEVPGEGGFVLGDGTEGTIAAIYSAVLAMPEGEGNWLVGAVNAKGTATF